MNINLGNYLEYKIKYSNYTKKDLCKKINELYSFEKTISYTTFSNNIKTGDITLNEAIAIATIIPDINLNKIVLIYKNKLQKNYKGEIRDMRNKIVEILKDCTISNVAKYKEENIYEIAQGEVYEALYLSDDYKITTLERVEIIGENGFVQEVAYFTNFDEILGECGIPVEEFKKIPLNEKLDFISAQGHSSLEVLGEEMRESSFDASKYLDNK